MKFFVVFFGFFLVIHAQERFDGQCPEVTVVQDFELNRYLGLWYEYAKYLTRFQSGKCTTAYYTPNADGSVGVLNKSILPSNNQEISIQGTAVPSGEEGEAKFTVSFPSSPAPSGGSNYWVLGTDYKHYAVVYSCQNFDTYHQKFAWILTRRSSPSRGTLKKANNVLDCNSVDRSLLVQTVQDCD